MAPVLPGDKTPHRRHYRFGTTYPARSKVTRQLVVARNSFQSATYSVYLLFKYVAGDDMWRSSQPSSTYRENSNQVFAEPVFHAI